MVPLILEVWQVIIVEGRTGLLSEYITKFDVSQNVYELL